MAKPFRKASRETLANARRRGRGPSGAPGKSAPRPWRAGRSRGVPLGLLAFAVLIGVAIGVVALGPVGPARVSAGVAPSAAPIVGRASVVDGDTLEIRGERIRLNGVDAPESRQTCQDASGEPYRCGQVAALALADHLDGQAITCQPQGHDQYGRTIATCAVRGEDLGAWLVRHGHAVDYVRYSEGAYAGAQLQARRESLGIWGGSFTNPEEFRRERAN